MNFLRRAQVMYHQRPQAVKDVCEERCENNYTMTMPLDRSFTHFKEILLLVKLRMLCFESSIAHKKWMNFYGVEGRMMVEDTQLLVFLSLCSRHHLGGINYTNPNHHLFRSR